MLKETRLDTASPTGVENRHYEEIGGEREWYGGGVMSVTNFSKTIS